MNQFVRASGQFILLMNILILIFLWVENESFGSYIAVFFILSNLIFIVAFWLDKRKAVRSDHRISELFLLFLSALGAHLVIYPTQFLLKHKTKKLQFNTKLVLALIGQTAILILLSGGLLRHISIIHIYE